MSKSILITAHTWLKQAPRQSVDLMAEDKVQARPGDRFPVARHESIEDFSKNDTDQHIQFVLVSPLNGKLSWYVYQRHACIMDGENLIFPAPEVDTKNIVPPAASKTFSGLRFKLPNGDWVYTDQPIIPGGFFSWGEATHNATRVAQMSAENQSRIIALAKRLQQVRQDLGKPVHVTSWFRPEPFNSKAGGARYSQHLTGGAVDIVCDGYSGLEMARKVEAWWPGGLGIYPGNRKHILHLDIGPKRKWGF